MLRHRFASIVQRLRELLESPRAASIPNGKQPDCAPTGQGSNIFIRFGLHAVEVCDAVEIQTYGKTCNDGTVVQVSNWLLRSWFIPGAAGPYDYMTFEKISGAVSPPGPLQTAPGHGGNYQIIRKWGGDKQVFAAARYIVGTRRKGNNPNWSSRAARRLKEIEHLTQIARAV